MGSNTVAGRQKSFSASMSGSRISPVKSNIGMSPEKKYAKLEYKPYTMQNKCSKCGKRFKEKFCLDKHMEVIHAEPKPKVI